MAKRKLKDKFRGVYSKKTDIDNLNDYKERILGNKDFDNISDTKENDFSESNKDTTLGNLNSPDLKNFKEIEKREIKKGDKKKKPYSSKKQKTFDFIKTNSNSIFSGLLIVLLGLAGWTLYTTHDLDKTVAVQQESINDFNKNLNELQEKYNTLNNVDVLEIREDISYLKGLLNQKQ